MRVVIMVAKDGSSNRIVNGKSMFQHSVDAVTDILHLLNSQDKVS